MGDNRELDRLLRAFEEQAGVNGFHNTVHQRGKTCEVCRGALLNSKPSVCTRCRDDKQLRAADRLGSVMYGCKGLESGDLMHRYKEPQAGGRDALMVMALTALGLRHRACVDLIAGLPSRHWATVPSLKRIGTEHPFRAILLQLLGQQSEVRIAAAPPAHRSNDSQRRQVNPDFYEVLTPVPRRTHITVIDDTWVSGGHAQSVAMALKNAGARQVSVLTIARWVDLQKPYPRWTYNNIIQTQPYDMGICPWTGGDCPPSQAAAGNEGPPGRRQMRCSLHNIELSETGECSECSRLIKRGSKPIERRKPWYQFW